MRFEFYYLENSALAAAHKKGFFISAKYSKKPDPESAVPPGISDLHGFQKSENRLSAYIFLLYCPPTSNKAVVICPKEQALVASINTSKMFSF